MGFLDDLLLGEGPEFQTRSLSTISPEQREALNQLIGQMQGRNPSQYGGQQNAGMSPFEQASLSALEERSKALAMPDAGLQAATGAVQKLTDFEGQTADSSAYFKSNVQDPMLESFQREILPQISRSFGGADFFSTERQASEGLAREDLLESLTAQKSAVELDQFNKSRERALQAAGLAPGLTQAENQRSQTQMDILKAAGIEREVEQAGLDRNYAEFARQQEEQKHIDEQMRQLTLTPTIENLAMEDPGNAGLLATLLGGMAAGAGKSLGNSNIWSNLLGRLFPDLFGSEEQSPQGQSTADGMPPNNTGTTVTDIPPVLGGGGGGATTPGGNVAITDMNTGQEVPSAPSYQGGVNLGGVAGGSVGAIAGQVGAGLAAPGGSAIITEAGGQLAHQVGSAAAGSGASSAGSVAAAESAGAAAGAPAGSGASISSAVGTAAAVVGALYGAYSTYEAASAGNKQGAVMSGAATGAAIGSVVPVIGTAVGAVIGAVVGLVGASFGNKENASELAYGSYKKIPTEATVRNWNESQVGGALFESIKSHTKSGNVNKFQDVNEMYSAFGITNDAHKNVENVKNQMQDFIKGVVQTAQAAGGLPTDPAKLALLDGQQIFQKLVKPALAAKVEEATGKPATSNAWSTGYAGETAKHMQNLFADYTDWITSHWGQDPLKINRTNSTASNGGRNTQER